MVPRSNTWLSASLVEMRRGLSPSRTRTVSRISRAKSARRFRLPLGRPLRLPLWPFRKRVLTGGGYTAPIRDAWRFTNQSNAFCNLMVTASVCMAGSDGNFDSMGEGMIINFDGTILAHGTSGRADEIITAEVRPDLVREARALWAVENNIYQFGHRGLTAVAGGAQDCPYTYMHDLVAGRYRLPWEDEVRHTDGTGFGYPKPARRYGDRLGRAAE